LSDRAAGDRAGTSDKPGWTLAASILASSLAFIDGSVTNVALPAIGHSLHAGAAGLQWTINAYLLPLSALLLLGGALGDHLGRRKLLIGGIALFLLASLACAVAGSLGQLLAARVAQGVGAAMLMPNSLAARGAAFAGEAKGRAIGTWAAAAAIGGAAGPPLGGWLVDVVGWRAIFLINLPIGAAAILIAWAHVGESDAGRQPIDWPGAALATAALGALTWSLTQASSEHRFGVGAVAGMLVGAALLCLLVVAERRRGDAAMMPLALFGSRAFAGLSLLTFLLYGALGGLLLLLPFVLITGGYTPAQAGFALLPFAGVIGAGSRAMGRLAARVGSRWPLSLGPLVTGAGFALLVRVDPSRSYWTSVLPALLVLAIGMAGAVAPLTTAVLASVDERHVGTASGFNSAVARTGGLIATALAGAVIAQAGGAVVASFHVAALVGAALAVASGAIAFVTLSSPSDAGRGC
jgi:EmrB/QacA subfamily drug resistance transporter